MSGYENYTLSPVPWIKQMPEHWGLVRGKNLYQKMQRPTSDTDEVVTCFRDGTVTLRKNRRTTGFTESLKEIGYQGIRKGDLVIHVMDAFAGSIGVSDSDGKGTPVYSVCQVKTMPFLILCIIIRFLYKGIIIKHNKTEPTYTKTSLFLCEKRRFFMARTEKGVVTTI